MKTIHGEGNPLEFARLHPAGNELVEQNIPLVGYAVSEMYARYPMVDRDEMVGAAMEGLVMAARSWDPEGGSKFTTWANLKVRWAIQELLQNLDWMGRRGRDRANRITKARNELATSLGHEPTDVELATALGIGLEDLKSAYGQSSRTLVAIDETAVEVPAPGQTPEERLVEAERDLQLHQAVQALPERTRRVVQLVYFAGMAQSEVAAQLGITDGTVSKEKAAGLSMLQEVLAEALHLHPAESVNARVSSAKREQFLAAASSSLAGGITNRHLAAAS